MRIEGQGHFFTIYFPGFVCFVLYLAKISGERLQDHWSSGLGFLLGIYKEGNLMVNANCKEFSIIYHILRIQQPELLLKKI